MTYDIEEIEARARAALANELGGEDGAETEEFEQLEEDDPEEFAERLKPHLIRTAFGVGVERGYDRVRFRSRRLTLRHPTPADVGKLVLFSQGHIIRVERLLKVAHGWCDLGRVHTEEGPGMETFEADRCFVVADEAPSGSLTTPVPTEPRAPRCFVGVKLGLVGDDGRVWWHRIDKFGCVDPTDDVKRARIIPLDELSDVVDEETSEASSGGGISFEEAYGRLVLRTVFRRIDTGAEK